MEVMTNVYSIVSDNKNIIINEETIYYCNYCNKEFDIMNDAIYHEKYNYTKIKSKKQKSNIKNKFAISDNTCYKCGRTEHYDETCYASSYADNNNKNIMYCWNYCNKKFDTMNDATCHEKFNCTKIKTKKQKSNIKNKITISDNTCYRCGRKGHYVENCYTTIHNKGHYLNN